jgi:putative ATP-binding cassette transporter
MLVVLLAGVVGGLLNASLLAFVHWTLSNDMISQTSLLSDFAALCVMLLLVKLGSQTLLVKFSSKAILGLRLHLCRQILAAPLRLLERTGAHRFLAMLTDDIPTITSALVSLPQFCMSVAIVIACVGYLAWLSPGVLAGIACFAAIGIVGYRLLVGMASRYVQRTREERDKLFRCFRALTDGTKELKLRHQRREAFFTRVLEPTAVAQQHYMVKSNIIFSIASGWGQTLFLILIGLLLFVLPVFKVVSVQILMGYLLTMLYMMGPLETVMGVLPMWHRASVAVQKVEEMGLSLSAHESDTGEAAPPVPTPSWNRLQLGGVSHDYEGEKDGAGFVLGPLDISFSPGELVFLAGGNGSGKTTFAKLLTGLYLPKEGRILLDGRPITDGNRDFYRQHFSAIFSDFYLFETLLGIDLPELDEEARNLLRMLQLDHKVRVKEGVLSTINLSQGQRKRLALLNAFLEDSSFYVFDEWAADQDPVFRDIFYTQLLPELRSRGKTALVISHDDRYYHVADRVVKLEYGKIIFDRPASPAMAAPPILMPAAGVRMGELQPEE